MDIKNKLDRLAKEVEIEVRDIYHQIDENSLKNHTKVLNAFREARVSDFHLKGGTGYGYGDAGREILEKIYARVFGGERALVRGQIVSGTHAIALCLFGVLSPGDELLAVQGAPYDTLEEAIGIRGNAAGSLKSYGIKYRQVDLLPNGELNWKGIEEALNSNTKMVMIQRSRGYAWRPSLSIAGIEKLVQFIRQRQPNTVIFVDNCYGELVEPKEPCDVGVDLVAGSLIKNPGGGVAPTGGYVVGRADLVQMAANRWTAPGIGDEVGPTLDHQRLLMQGIFLAPHVVAEALKGAVFTARLFERLGFEISPLYDEYRTDIIQAVALGDADKLVEFCRGLQSASPVDSHVRPEPDGMPGYDDAVVMAAGTFVQGASIELSADGPLRPPYAVYMQGGLSKEYIKLGVLSAAEAVLRTAK
ncbi:cystathionine beta-lyase family protein involved in aluminum resistance [Desulfohalotomaculum tongense]|uniref:methionine gamma-lyase family protein n=1 Tax=Desulforadius tongensis TaxID=1216062 RepID=UPI001958F84B|nr:methionine gamma-lyase family protein [Desulforadius tongensis]MBM7854138.1 cystathionine beta-lyase family protein involved in aluminum resistance [Desulforadius tongensis]